MSDRDPTTRLFRAEAIAEQQDRRLGSVLLVPRLTYSVLAGFALVVILGILAIFTFGEYTRKTRLGGWIAPEGGLIQVVAPQTGILTRIHVEEGEEVAAGARLAILSTELRSEAFGATRGEVLRQLRTGRDSMTAERARRKQIFEAEARQIEARLEVAAREADGLAREIEVQVERVALAERILARQRDLRDRDIVTEQTLEAAAADALDQKLALQALERERTALARSRLDLEADRENLPLEEAAQLEEIARAILELDREIAEAEAAREVVIVAPEAGTVTALQAAAGSSIGPEAPLLTLVPEGAKLQAQLYGPSRAIGFVRPGQKVRLRYEPFPHQKFGQYEGTVTSVTRSTLGAAESAGAPMSPAGSAAAEPLYRVTVDLASQSVAAYGEAVALQPGMRLEADILIETRRLYRWVLDPLDAMRDGGAA